MTFRRKVHNGSDSVSRQQFGDQIAFANITANESVPFVVLQLGKIRKVSGVSELVQSDHGFVEMREPIKYKIRTNESSAPCDQQCHAFSLAEFMSSDNLAYLLKLFMHPRLT